MADCVSSVSGYLVGLSRRGGQWVLAWSVCMSAVALVACEEEIPQQTQRGAPQAAAQAQPEAGEEAEAEPAKPAAAELTYADDHFVESDANRDPFRDFLSLFKVRRAAAPQREVLMGNVAVDEMKLIAIVTGVPKPRAMLVDPLGIGHVVERGMYIGRPQVLQTGGADNVALTLNWRVDRIRDNEVVLSRDDPTDPSRPALTRIIPLHDRVGGAL